jgi:hypothetical protein
MIRMFLFCSKTIEHDYCLILILANMPSGRWIVNFDIDLVDSIVLGTVLGAYCPFLVCIIH